MFFPSSYLSTDWVVLPMEYETPLVLPKVGDIRGTPPGWNP